VEKVDIVAPCSCNANNNNNDKWSKNFDKRQHRRGIFTGEDHQSGALEPAAAFSSAAAVALADAVIDFLLRITH